MVFEMAASLALLAEAINQQVEPSEAEFLAAIEDAISGQLLNNPLDPQWQVFGEGASSKVIKAPEIPGQRAFQLRVTEPAVNPWEISAHGAIKGAVEAGDTVFVAFWARATKFSATSGGGQFQARVQQKSAPYAGVAEQSFLLKDHWQVHYMSGAASRAYSAGELDISFNVGAARQTVEFGQFYVADAGATPGPLPSGSADPE